MELDNLWEQLLCLELDKFWELCFVWVWQTQGAVVLSDFDKLREQFLCLSSTNSDSVALSGARRTLRAVALSGARQTQRAVSLGKFWEQLLCLSSTNSKSSCKLWEQLLCLSSTNSESFALSELDKLREQLLFLSSNSESFALSELDKLWEQLLCLSSTNSGLLWYFNQAELLDTTKVVIR